MAYTNAEHIFMSALGTLPTDAQWKDIHTILGTLEGCRILVNDPATAPHLVDLAWRWARIPRGADVTDKIRALTMDLVRTVDAQTTLLQGLVEKIDARQPAPQEESPAPIDQTALAASIAQAMPAVRVELSLSAIKEVFREVLTNAVWVGIGLALVATGYVCFHWGEGSADQVSTQLQAQIRQQQETIDRLTAGRGRGAGGQK
jgi:hypothetical protein